MWVLIVYVYVHVQILDYLYILYECYTKFTYTNIMIVDYFILLWTWTLHIFSLFMIHIIDILVHPPLKKGHVLVDSCFLICFLSTSKFSLDKTGRSDSCGFPVSWVTKLPWKLNDPPILCLLSSLAQLNLGSTTSFDPPKKGLMQILRIFTAECLAMFSLKTSFGVFW